MAESEIPVRNVLQIREMQKAKDYYAKLATQLCICLLHSAHGPILYFNFDYIDYFPQLHKHRREKKKKKKKESKSFKINAIRKVKGDSTDSGIYPFFTACLVTRESCFHSSLCFLSSGALLQTVSHIGSLRLPALPESNLQALCMPWEHLSQHLSPWRLSTLDWEWPQGT